MIANVYTNEELRAVVLNNATAFMKSNHIWVVGYQSIVESMEQATQARLEQRRATWGSNIDSRSPYQVALEIQSDLIRAAFQRSLTEAARLTKTSFQVMEQTMQPIVTYMARPAATSSSLDA